MIMSTRDYTYDSSLNWCYISEPNYAGEVSKNRCYKEAQGEDELLLKPSSKIISKKHVIYSDELAKKLSKDHGIKPGFLEHTRIPLGSFIEAITDEINLSENKEKTIRHESNHEQGSRKVIDAACYKNLSRSAGKTSVVRTEAGIDDENYDRNTRIVQNVSKHNSRNNRMANDEKFRRKEIDVVEDSGDCQEDNTFSAELRKKTLQTKHFVSNQILKVKNLFSITDSPSKTISRKEQSIGIGNKKKAFNSLYGKKEMAPGTPSSNLQAKIEYCSNRSTLKKSLISPKNSSDVNRVVGNRNPVYSYKRTDSKSREFQNQNQNRSSERESKNMTTTSRRSNESPQHQHSVVKVPTQGDSKELKLNISCTIDKNGTRSINIIDVEKELGENNPPYNRSRASENQISPDGLIIDLCYGSESINVLPGSSITGNTFSSTVLKKCQRSGSYLMASDSLTGSMFRLDIPDKLFANDTVPFSSKSSLVNFILEVLNDPSADFVPMDSKPVTRAEIGATNTKRLSEKLGKPCKMSNLAVKKANEPLKLNRNEINKSRNIFSNNTRDQKQRNQITSSERCGPEKETPGKSRDIKVKPDSTGSEINWPARIVESFVGVYSSVSDISCTESRKSNNMQSDKPNISDESCNESHCLRYKFNAKDIRDSIDQDPQSNYSLDLEDVVGADNASACSQTPVMKSCSNSSKVRYKIYYQPSGAKSPWSKTRIGNDQHYQEKRKPLIIKKRKMSEEIVISTQIKKDLPSKVLAVSNKNNIATKHVQGDSNLAKMSKYLSISSPLAFDNKNNIFSFKEEPSCTVSPDVSHEVLNCPLFCTSSSENLVKASESVCSWTSHGNRSYTDFHLNSLFAQPKEPELFSSWKTVTEENNKRRYGNANEKNTPRETVKEKSDLKSTSNPIKDNEVFRITPYNHNQNASNAYSKSLSPLVGTVEVPSAVAAEASSSVNTSNDVLTFLKSSRHNLNRCSDETKTQVDLIAKSCEILNYLSQFSPTFRLIASSPMLGEVILLTYFTIFGPTQIENEHCVKNVLSNSNQLRNRCNSV